MQTQRIPGVTLVSLNNEPVDIETLMDDCRKDDGTFKNLVLVAGSISWPPVRIFILQHPPNQPKPYPLLCHSSVTTLARLTKWVVLMLTWPNLCSFTCLARVFHSLSELSLMNLGWGGCSLQRLTLPMSGQLEIQYRLISTKLSRIESRPLRCYKSSITLNAQSTLTICQIISMPATLLGQRDIIF